VPLPAADKWIWSLTDQITPDDRAGDFAQAMMDMGATICTPRSPKCDACPVNAHCKGRDTPMRYPVKPIKKPRPERTGTALWITRGDQVLLVMRPAKGLLGNMRALPSWGWDNGCEPPTDLRGIDCGSIVHVFTHFRLTLDVIAVESSASLCEQFDGTWWPIDQIGQAGLPSVFMKAAQRAMGGL
jgi:A/G-specific adenine glycosylase